MTLGINRIILKLIYFFCHIYTTYYTTLIQKRLRLWLSLISTMSNQEYIQQRFKRPHSFLRCLRGRPVSILGQVMWDLWWTMWHWGGFSPSASVSPAKPHSTNCSKFINNSIIDTVWSRYCKRRWVTSFKTSMSADQRLSNDVLSFFCFVLKAAWYFSSSTYSKATSTILADHNSRTVLMSVRSSTARIWRSWVQIPLGVWMSATFKYLCCSV
jgi:hypothetical protein